LEPGFVHIPNGTENLYNGAGRMKDGKISALDKRVVCDHSLEFVPNKCQHGFILMSLPIQRLLLSSKPMVMVLALALMWSIGYLDYITGRDFSVSTLYLVPIFWGAWVAGRSVGILLAIVGAVTWFIADSMSEFVYDYPWLPYWNALMLLVVFLVAVYLLMRFQTARQTLEKTVQERTEALQALQAEIEERKRLEDANLKAERLAVVGRMAAQVAHEIRNPLGSITLNLDLIRKELRWLAEGKKRSPEEGHALVKDMREEVTRIGRVIEDYLRFARLPKLRRQPLALNAFLEQKLAFLCAELEGTNIRLQTHFDPALTTINGGADQLWQAVLNLIRNSCDAMPDGGELTVSTLCDGGEVLLRVMDNGKGMSEEQRQQVFTPFFTTKNEGLGLGMALVHQIVAEHGGHIECESASGKGSTFTIFLPLAENP
jgi:signal transduction histidine kinase